jgi:Tol biopolymer transport system component/DNA-binding winged helix-turn-helix (wHTH) protein
MAVYTFAGFRLDADAKLLSRDGNIVSLPPKAAELLVVLVEGKGQLVTKEQLLQQIWPDTFVEEHNLVQYVSLLRRSLGNGDGGHALIETFPKRGYRFTGVVTAEAATEAPLSEPRVEVLLPAEGSPRPRATHLLASRPRLVIGTTVVLIGAILAATVGLRTRSKPAADPPSFVQLTDQPGEELYPSLSPDGKSIVYASRATGNWDIYLQRVGGKNPVNLTRDSEADDTQPAFSPQGDQITFRSERDGGGIFLMGGTGENVKRLTYFGYYPAWSPDGREIVCASATFFDPKVRLSTQSQLYSVSVATGAKRLIATPGTSLAMQPSWSPHGNRIAYWALVGSQLDVLTVPVGGGEPVAVTHDLAVDWNPVWSPDGAYLYFVSDRGGSMNLWRVAIDEKSGTVLGALEPVTAPSSETGFLSFSHSGHQITYAARSRTGNIMRVGFDPSHEAVVGQLASVTQGSRAAVEPSVSPDGEWIAFYNSGKHENLFVVRKDGTGLRQLTDSVYSDRRPVWSPDGEFLAFQSNRSGKFEVWVIRSDGSGLRQLTFTPDPYVVHPVWSPDGKRLAYSIQNSVPHVMEFDTPWRSQSPKALPPLNVPDTWYEVGSWSPDGNKLAGFQLRNDGKFTGISVYSLETGKYERLTDFGWEHHWLNDSRRLIFTTGKDGQIYLVDSRSRKVHEILSVAPNLIAPSAAISPDNHWIYFSMIVHESDIWLGNLGAASRESN